jgi:uncharacterized protein YutE (UPF0331/DUF86 family)
VIGNAKLLLLQEELQNLSQAAAHLEFSKTRTKEIIHQNSWTPEELERLESLSSRFARLSDLLVQKIMRVIDELELISGGTMLDRIQRAEKRNWVDSASELLQIRELRNLIAHEYAADKMAEIYQAVAVLTPTLLAIVPKITIHAEQLIEQYSNTLKSE